jgi:hypothetical protein
MSASALVSPIESENLSDLSGGKTRPGNAKSMHRRPLVLLLRGGGQRGSASSNAMSLRDAEARKDWDFD